MACELHGALGCDRERLRRRRRSPAARPPARARRGDAGRRDHVRGAAGRASELHHAPAGQGLAARWPYAAAYTKQIRVRVSPRDRRITNLRAALYTFGGQRIGASRPRTAVRGRATLTVRLKRIVRPCRRGVHDRADGRAQPRPVLRTKQATRVLRFRACTQAAGDLPEPARRPRVRLRRLLVASDPQQRPADPRTAQLVRPRRLVAGRRAEPGGAVRSADARPRA